MSSWCSAAAATRASWSIRQVWVEICEMNGIARMVTGSTPGVT
jgi:hypothetical protein